MPILTSFSLVFGLLFKALGKQIKTLDNKRETYPYFRGNLGFGIPIKDNAKESQIILLESGLTLLHSKLVI